MVLVYSYVPTYPIFTLIPQYSRVFSFRAVFLFTENLKQSSANLNFYGGQPYRGIGSIFLCLHIVRVLVSAGF